RRERRDEQTRPYSARHTPSLGETRCCRSSAAVRWGRADQRRSEAASARVREGACTQRRSGRVSPEAERDCVAHAAAVEHARTGTALTPARRVAAASTTTG